jgi:hypothetical protein
MQFEERAVAFIDVLGFKALVNKSASDSSSLAQLGNLVELLSSAVPSLDKTVDTSIPQHLIPKHIYISDCIILSAPLKDEDRASYDGLQILVMRVIQLSHFFLSAGYLVRGGISVGKVWHTDSNIVGPAYQEAFNLEQEETAPIVVLSDHAASQWTGNSRMCLTHEDKIFVNGLFDHYISNNTQHGAIERAYANYATLAEQRLAECLPDSAKQKWAWFRNFLASEAPEGLKWAQAAA